MSTEALPTPFSKGGKSGGKLGSKMAVTKRGKKKKPSYKAYTYKVLKQVHKDLGMSKKAMVIFDNYIVDILERMAIESGKLAKRQKKTTLKAREMMTSAKLVLPGELARHACAQGKKAVEKFAAAGSVTVWNCWKDYPRR